MVSAAPPSTAPLKASVLDKLIGDLGRTRGDGGRDPLPCHVPALDRFSEAELRGCVLRDVGWILNDIHFAAAVPLGDHPEVATSVLNHGVPDLSGMQVNRESLSRRADDIARAIRTYEPRLIAKSVRVSFEKASVDNENKLRFIIHGELRQALDDRYIELKTSVELDTGEVEVTRGGRT